MKNKYSIKKSLNGFKTIIIPATIVLVLFLKVFFITGCNNYGKQYQIDSTTIFFTNSISEDEVKKLANFLKETGFVGKQSKQVQFNKEKDVYQFKIIVEDKYLNDPDFLKNAKIYASQMSLMLFDEKPVELHLCDDKFNSIKSEKSDLSLVKSKFGKPMTIDGTTVFYSNKISKEEATKFANYLKESAFTDGNPKTVQLTKEADNYIFKIIIAKNVLEDTDYTITAKKYAAQLSMYVFNNQKVIIHLCDDSFKVLKAIEEDKSLIKSDFGKLLVFDGTEIYYSDNVSQQEVEKFGNYLKSSGFTDGTLKSVQLDKTGNRYLFKIVINPSYLNDAEYNKTTQLYAVQVSQTVFNNQPVDIHYCDNTFKTLKTINMK